LSRSLHGESVQSGKRRAAAVLNDVTLLVWEPSFSPEVLGTDRELPRGQATIARVASALRWTCAVCSLACSLLHALCYCVPWLWSLRLDTGSADAGASFRLLLSGTLWFVFAVCDAPMILYLCAAPSRYCR